MLVSETKLKSSNQPTLRRFAVAFASLGAAMAIARPASASVTLYGLMDMGVDYVSNEGHGASLKLTSGELQQSRFGLLGTEDLSDGMQAVFKLENGFNAANGALGAAGTLWSREARVGLVTRAGSVSLGLQPASMVDYLGKYTASMLVYGPAYYSAHPGNYDRVLNFPISNSIKYTTPLLGGFSASALFGFGGQPGSITAQSTWSFGVGYDQGPLSIGAGYMKVNGPIGTAGILASTANPFTTTNANDALQTYGVGGSYEIGSSLLFALFTQAQFRDADTKARTYELGVKSVVAHFWTLGGDISHTDVPDHHAHLTTLSVSAAYALSKRTDVYGTFAVERASGTNIDGTPLAAQLFSLGAASSGTQSVFRIALRHKF